jgi:hypothetical protein
MENIRDRVKVFVICVPRAGRRQNFQPEFFRNLHPARDALRLLGVFADGHQRARFHRSFFGVFSGSQNGFLGLTSVA